MVDVEPISRGSDEITTESLDEVYKKLYDSLGVEPGLLAKTKIGRDLHEKYRNDGDDAIAYSMQALDDVLTNQNEDITASDDKIIRLSVDGPVLRALSDDESECTPLLRHLSLNELIREYQLEHGLTYLELITELQTFFKTHYNQYITFRNFDNPMK